MSRQVRVDVDLFVRFIGLGRQDLSAQGQGLLVKCLKFLDSGYHEVQMHLLRSLRVGPLCTFQVVNPFKRNPYTRGSLQCAPIPRIIRVKVRDVLPPKELMVELRKLLGILGIQYNVPQLRMNCFDHDASLSLGQIRLHMGPEQNPRLTAPYTHTVSTMTNSDDQQLTTDPTEVKKVHDLMESTDIAMLTTADSAAGDGRLVSRPLSTQVAEDGDVLFLVRSSSSVAADVRANPNVNVAYSSNKAWVSLSGAATIVHDRELVEKLWSKGADMFMDGGPENQDNVILKINGDTATYWGGKSLIGTAVKTIGAIRNKDDDAGQGGPTTVKMP